MVRDVTHKLAVYHDGSLAAATEGELYDLTADPAAERDPWPLFHMTVARGSGGCCRRSP